MKGKGDFLENLKHAKRLKELSIEFSKGETIKWHDKVYKELPVRIGVYAIIDRDNEVIYIGKATGKGGLKARHISHEKRELFKLFDAREIIPYFADGKDVDDNEILMLLERYMIYTHLPTLNNDFKGYKPIQIEVSEKMVEKISDNKLETQDFYREIYEKQKSLLDDVKNAGNKFRNAVYNDEKGTESEAEITVTNKEKPKTLEELKADYKEELRKLKDFNKENTKRFNEEYEKVNNEPKS